MFVKQLWENYQPSVKKIPNIWDKSSPLSLPSLQESHNSNPYIILISQKAILYKNSKLKMPKFWLANNVVIFMWNQQFLSKHGLHDKSLGRQLEVEKKNLFVNMRFCEKKYLLFLFKLLLDAQCQILVKLKWAGVRGGHPSALAQLAWQEFGTERWTATCFTICQLWS